MEARVATGPGILTADDVLELPAPDGSRGYELVDGQPVLVMSGFPMHGRLVVEVAYRLERHVREHGSPGLVFSDALFVLGLPRDPERARAPDVIYVESSKLVGHDLHRAFRGIPDLAVEIDVTKKPGAQERIVEYVEAGVWLVWAIEPRSRTATVYRSDGSARLIRREEALEGEDVLPGFRLAMGELFGAVPESGGR
jgi:Uma2 family endonuclease